MEDVVLAEARVAVGLHLVAERQHDGLHGANGLLDQAVHRLVALVKLFEHALPDSQYMQTMRDEMTSTPAKGPLCRLAARRARCPNVVLGLVEGFIFSGSSIVKPQTNMPKARTSPKGVKFALPSAFRVSSAEFERDGLAVVAAPTTVVILVEELQPVVGGVERQTPAAMRDR